MCLCMCVCVFMHVRMCVYACAYMCLCMCVHMHVCICFALTVSGIEKRPRSTKRYFSLAFSAPGTCLRGNLKCHSFISDVSDVSGKPFLLLRDIVYIFCCYNQYQQHGLFRCMIVILLSGTFRPEKGSRAGCAFAAFSAQCSASFHGVGSGDFFVCVSQRLMMNLTNFLLWVYDFMLLLFFVWHLLLQFSSLTSDLASHVTRIIDCLIQATPEVGQPWLNFFLYSRQIPLVS